jgi:hypothetical protein
VSTYAQRVQLGPFFSSGVLQGGAKLYHYAAGSSTLKNIWLDRDQLTTLAQPFVADSDGVFNFFADGLYKLIVVGPDSTGPTDDVLYTLDNWQLLDPAADITWSEEAAVASASSIALGPGIWQHVTGSTTIATMTMTGPFAWLVFDGNLTLTYSANLLTPAGIDLAVRQNDVLFVLNEGSGVVRISNHYQYDGLLIATQDSRTSSSDVGLTVRSTTSGTPAAGIGTDILLQAESADETPSDVVQVGGAFSDVSAGSEDSYWRVLLRVAGAALTECWRFASAAAFKGILTHTNTADRTYTFPNASYVLDAGECYKGPTSCGTGSTRSHEGTVTVASNGNYSGVHFYTDFTLNSGVTMTIPAGSGRLVIIASGTITINGTITGAGGGLLAGGTGGTTNGSSGNGGTDQAAGAGGGNAGAGYSGGNGGSALSHGVTVQSGGGGSTGAGGAGTQLSGSSALLHDYAGLFGGASGGGGSGDGASSGGSGGRGGASIILLAPTIVLAVTGALVTSGSSGANAPSSTQAAGGGGAAGNIIIITRSYTDNGCTFTMTGGSGGTGNTANAAAGGAGAAGVKQINIFV